MPLDNPNFKLKQTEIYAEQYLTGDGLPLPYGVKVGNLGRGCPEAYIVNSHGLQAVHPFDWVINGLGEPFAMTNEVFRELCEPIV